MDDPDGGDLGWFGGAVELVWWRIRGCLGVIWVGGKDNVHQRGNYYCLREFKITLVSVIK